MSSSFAPSASPLHPTEGIGQDVICNISQWQSSRTTSIHILDNDSLLNIFYLYRPAGTVADDSKNENFGDDHIYIVREGRWDHKHANWWYKPAHVCRRWRDLILRSASFLGVYLVCTVGTPVAHMLATNPLTVPLVIDYLGGYTAAKGEEGISLALEQTNRIRCIRLESSLHVMQKFVRAIYHELPILEYLVLVMTPRTDDVTFALPETIQAPRLRHLALVLGPPIRPRLLTTASDLVTLRLFMGHSPTFIDPNSLLQRISPLSRLETLEITTSPDHRAVEARLSHTPTTTTHTILPYLRLLSFRGVCAYLEVLIRQTATPRLERLHAIFFAQPVLSIPCLARFMNTSEDKTLRFDTAKFEFYHYRVSIVTYSHEENRRCSFGIGVWNTTSMIQIVDLLGQVFWAVKNLILDYHEEDIRSNDIEVLHMEWNKLLRPFNFVKNFFFNVDEKCFRNTRLRDAFTSFVDARQKAGHPVSFKLIGRSPSPSP